MMLFSIYQIMVVPPKFARGMISHGNIHVNIVLMILQGKISKSVTQDKSF